MPGRSLTPGPGPDIGERNLGLEETRLRRLFQPPGILVKPRARDAAAALDTLSAAFDKYLDIPVLNRLGPVRQGRTIQSRATQIRDPRLQFSVTLQAIPAAGLQLGGKNQCRLVVP